MRKHKSLWSVGALAIALAIPATVVAPAHAADTIKIGIIASTSGPLKPYGDAYMAGLDFGLRYLTRGTMMVNGRSLEVIKKDDGASAATATSEFKDLVGSGVNLIAGTTSSTVALTLAPLATQNKVLYISGPAKIDLLTTPGSPFASRYVFRSGAQSAQDVAALKSLPVRGKKVALFVEDNAFGNGNIAAVERVLGAKGATFIEVKVSTTATDFLPYTTKVAAAKPAYVFVAWSNSLTAGLAFTGLKQQGLFQSAHMVTGLANVAAYQITGGLFDGANGPVMTNSYFPGVSKTAIGAALAADYAKSGAAQDLFTPDGVNAAQMILKALKGNTDLNVDTMITNLQGFSFLGVKGRMMVRSNDHVLVQPMYTVALAKVNGVYAPQLLGTVYNVAP